MLLFTSEDMENITITFYLYFKFRQRLEKPLRNLYFTGGWTPNNEITDTIVCSISPKE